MDSVTVRRHLRHRRNQERWAAGHRAQRRARSL